MTSTDVKIDDKVNVVIREPSKYNVLFLNDDKTTFEFVIALLEGVFSHSRENAVELTRRIHEQDKAVVGTYSFEIAEQKCMEATTLSRTNGFPLQIKVESV